MSNNTSASAVEEVQPVVDGFSYADLNEVDPTVRPVPVDFYNLKIMKAELKTFKYSKTTKFHNADDLGEMVKFQLAIQDDPNFSGRRIFPALFQGRRELIALRKLMDVTGVGQTPGTPLTEWLKTLTEVQPNFRAKVIEKPGRQADAAGNVIGENDVDWRELLPV